MTANDLEHSLNSDTIMVAAENSPGDMLTSLPPSSPFANSFFRHLSDLTVLIFIVKLCDAACSDKAYRRPA